MEFKIRVSFIFVAEISCQHNVDFLKQTNWEIIIMIEKAFPQFSAELLEALEHAGTVKQYKAGDVLAKKGRPLRGVYIMVEGTAKVAQQNAEGNEFVIGYLKPGDSFAVSINEDSPEADKIAVMNITAMETVQVLLLSFADKDRLAKSHDVWYKYILRTALRFYREYIEVIECIAFQKMDTRIKFFLKKLSQTKKTNVLQISHQEIAEAVNTSREVVSRLLKIMESQGEIKTAQNTVKIISNL